MGLANSPIILKIPFYRTIFYIISMQESINLFTSFSTFRFFESKHLYTGSYIHLYNMKKVLHSPTLESVRMVEKTIKKYSQEYGKYQLWKHLPKKMMYQTFLHIIDYLEENGRIMIDKRDGIVFWTWDPEGIKKILATGVKLR